MTACIVLNTFQTNEKANFDYNKNLFPKGSCIKQRSNQFSWQDYSIDHATTK